MSVEDSFRAWQSDAVRRDAVRCGAEAEAEAGAKAKLGSDAVLLLACLPMCPGKLALAHRPARMRISTREPSFWPADNGSHPSLSLSLAAQQEPFPSTAPVEAAAAPDWGIPPVALPSLPPCIRKRKRSGTHHWLGLAFFAVSSWSSLGPFVLLWAWATSSDSVGLSYGGVGW